MSRVRRYNKEVGQNMEQNLILTSDFYKFSHWKQYPPGTTKIYSYLEARGGDFKETVFFGLQYYLKKYLTKPITKSDIDEAENIVNLSVGPGVFNRAGWDHILNVHNGYLPIRIKAVPEGSVVSTGNVLMTIENTDSACYWLTNFIETHLMKVWATIAVATLSRSNKQIIAKYLEETGDLSSIDFRLVDFGARGVSSEETASVCGAAHLVNFKSTDTVAAIKMVRDYYSNDSNYMPGFSIPASEHSTITSWGKENEVKACENMLDQYPIGLVACVSDSYDIMNCCANVWGGVLKNKILDRDGTLVIRPDSGDPVSVTLQVINILSEKFGYTTNEKGYKVLNPKVRIIQGDGVNPITIGKILENFKNHQWSADNISFGSGGALLQKVNRDSISAAIKCSYAEVNGESREVYKQPATDSGKSSKRGRLKLLRSENGEYSTVSESTVGGDVLRTVFENGKLLETTTFEEIRARAAL